MTITTYAYGRTVLPTPIITASIGGSIAGNNANYYFWIKAKNRVGYNQISAPLTLQVPNSGQIIISAANFTAYTWEDWREFSIFSSKTNDFSTSRLIFTQQLYAEDQVTTLSIPSTIIGQDYVLNGTSIIATTGQFPTSSVPNGYLIKVENLNKIFRFDSGSNLPIDNISVFAGNSGQWLLTDLESLNILSFTCTKEVVEVTEDEFLAAPLESFLQVPVPLKYYIVNNGSTPASNLQLNLNEFISDSNITARFYVNIIGYLNLTNYTLDTNNIDFVGTSVIYPETNIRLSKPLPANSAFVISVVPDISTSSAILNGSFITLYPILSSFTTLDGTGYWDEPVANLAALKALNTVQYANNQVRLVVSKKQAYYFDADSELDDDGDTVISPNTNPETGRWLIFSASIQPQSITESQLSPDVIELFSSKIRTTTVDIANPVADYQVNLDTDFFDYYILQCPVNDVSNTITVINFLTTLNNNETKAILVELRQKTGALQFHPSVSFPGGELPVLSGANKTDLFMISFVKDSSGTVKKRAYMAQRDIG